MNLKDIGCKGVARVQLAQDRVQWEVHMNATDMLTKEDPTVCDDGSVTQMLFLDVMHCPVYV